MSRHDGVLSAALTAAILMTMLSGCGRNSTAPEPAETVSNHEPAAQAETAEPSQAAIITENQEAAQPEKEGLSITGLWQTASMGYAADGTMSPEHYVRFTDSDILYGHLEDGQFVTDYADRIVSLEEAPAGGYRVKAESIEGIRYTYQTCESDDQVLEYYDTWREEEFPEMYRGGASLSRCG